MAPVTFLCTPIPCLSSLRLLLLKQRHYVGGTHSPSREPVFEGRRAVYG